MFILIQKYVLKIFLLRLHYIIFTIFHRSPFPSFIVYTKLSFSLFFYLFFFSLSSQNHRTKKFFSVEVGRRKHKKIPHFVIALLCDCWWFLIIHNVFFLLFSNPKLGSVDNKHLSFSLLTSWSTERFTQTERFLEIIFID